MAHIDRYKNFEELASNEREGADYQVLVEPRGSDVAVIAPHGGDIEPGTSEIARAIAGNELSLYRFEGWKSSGNYKALHITGVRFDEHRCIELVRQCRTVVAVHGLDGDDQAVHVGGLEEKLKRDVIRALTGAGFNALEDVSDHSGRDGRNICNRSVAGKGLQLEVTEGLRRAMFQGWSRRDRGKTTEIFDRFVAAIRAVLLR